MRRIHAALAHIHANRLMAIGELQDFIRFPSVSMQSKYAGEVNRCARWLASQIRQAGITDTQIIPTPGHPLVYAAWRKAPGLPTLLIYGHYDVQPVDPLNEWRTPPFEPIVQDNHLYGRGASDDKGQMYAHIKAIQAYLQTAYRLPVNVICLFEGEEEIGSPNLQNWLKDNPERLKADLAVISDTRMRNAQRPALTYALRGGLGLELVVKGPGQDLHSGTFGGAIHNPLQALCELIARLHDADHRVAIPGFYDSVRVWSGAERDFMRRSGLSDAEILRDALAQHSWGEAGYSLYERTTTRPALTVNGITGGYQEAGGKAVIPRLASAKLSFRLAPDQDPAEVDRLFRAYIHKIAPPTIQVQIHTRMSARPALIDRNHPGMRAAAFAYRQGFGALPVYLRSGGTIPVVNMLQEIVGIPTVLMGFALGDDNKHAPNERFYLPNFYNGIATCIWFMAALSKYHPSHLPNGIPTARVPGRGLKIDPQYE
jgi:acetylornithine deacetylase/succinyl-diaminopimelate desuccinylase-like protein